MVFSLYDIRQIKAKGLAVSDIEHQLAIFNNGIKPVKIVSAAKINNGIEVFPKETEKALISVYETKKEHLQIAKFVPASGAATRMFQFLFQFINTFNAQEESLNKYLANSSDKDAIVTFFNAIKNFAFYKKLKKKHKVLFPYKNTLTKGERWLQLAQTILDKKGLNYATLPKGLILFHTYKNRAVTAFEEHLYEAAFYAAMGNDVLLHFTFSESHVKDFKKHFEKISPKLKKATGYDFHISFSFQKKETDTIAVDPNNIPIRDKDGNLVFRPSGHGALLENLNNIEADLVFIKNIDNVATRKYTQETAYYKKVLAGKLLQIQEKIFAVLNKIDKKEVSQEVLQEARTLLFKELNVKNPPQTKEALFRLLNRPIRVCGMVKNTGAPGGGPFWVLDKNEKMSLQIVELSQIDITETSQQNIINQATHFNPVDIVCGLKNYKGIKFDLKQFTNPKWSLISKKTFEGKPIKALEMPGLWNGAMADWNTIFVEVPLITFNPVKTVNDLLKPEHQPF
jgi:hypothetical protein